MWSTFKKSFDAWEKNAAAALEAAVADPTLLGAAGWMFTGLANARDVRDRLVATFWEELGLPTRRQQERALHLLQQLESRILDLEDRLADAAAERPAPPTGA